MPAPGPPAPLPPCAPPTAPLVPEFEHSSFDFRFKSKEMYTTSPTKGLAVTIRGTSPGKSTTPPALKSQKKGLLSPPPWLPVCGGRGNVAGKSLRGSVNMSSEPGSSNVGGAAKQYTPLIPEVSGETWTNSCPNAPAPGSTCPFMLAIVHPGALSSANESSRAMYRGKATRVTVLSIAFSALSTSPLPFSSRPKASRSKSTTVERTAPPNAILWVGACCCCCCCCCATFAFTKDASSFLIESLPCTASCACKILDGHS